MLCMLLLLLFILFPKNILLSDIVCLWVCWDFFFFLFFFFFFFFWGGDFVCLLLLFFYFGFCFVFKVAL